MAHESLERANEEIEKASEAADDEEVKQQIRNRAEQLARLAERLDNDTDNETLDLHRNAIRPVSVNAGDAVNAPVIEANEQLSKFLESIGY